MPVPKNVPRATVLLDRPRTITLQLDAVQRLCGVLGVGMDGLGEALGQFMTNLDAWVWAGLIDEDREISQAEVRAMIHIGNLPQLSEAILDVARDSLPKGAEGNGGGPAPAKVKRVKAGR